MKSLARSLYRFLSPKFQNVFLDYPVRARPRYGHGQPAHPMLFRLINARRDHYADLLREFVDGSAALTELEDCRSERGSLLPCWNNGFLPGLDMLAIFGMITHYKPRVYLEVGSGNSTKIAAFAIKRAGLSTEIISVDPHPRADIDELAGTVIRQGFEDVKDPGALAEKLEAGDILFIDNSHRSFPNSDVTVFFLELLPRLKPGVVVHIHDIYLPYDYPDFMCERFYNEQYLLATALLANPEKYPTLFPCYFISIDDSLSQIAGPFWDKLKVPVEKHGGSFWFVTT